MISPVSTLLHLSVDAVSNLAKLSIRDGGAAAGRKADRFDDPITSRSGRVDEAAVTVVSGGFDADHFKTPWLVRFFTVEYIITIGTVNVNRKIQLFSMFLRA